MKSRNKLSWVATYIDNTVLTQYDNNGVERSSEQIDRSKLLSFSLYDFGGNKFVEQRYKSGQLFMYRCRTAMSADNNIIEKIHIIVCRDGDKQHVLFVFESDLHIEIGDFNYPNDINYNKWLYPIEPVSSDLIHVGS